MTTLCSNASLAKTEKQYFATLDDTELDKLKGSCREYTLPRSDKSSQEKGRIRGNTKIGPALEVTVVKVSMDCCSVGEMKSMHVFCHLCKCKNLGDDRIVDKIMRSISDTENTKIALKTDGRQDHQREGPTDNPREPASV